MKIIPEAYRDLVSDTSKAIAYLATTMPDGSPIIAPVWFGVDGEMLLISTSSKSLKAQNMEARPQVAVVLQDPDDVYRFLQIRGTMVGSFPDPDQTYLHRFSRRYIGRDYPDAVDDDIVYRIQPEKVNVFHWTY